MCIYARFLWIIWKPLLTDKNQRKKFLECRYVAFSSRVKTKGMSFNWKSNLDFEFNWMKVKNYTETENPDTLVISILLKNLIQLTLYLILTNKEKIVIFILIIRRQKMWECVTHIFDFLSEFFFFWKEFSFRVRRGDFYL